MKKNRKQASRARVRAERETRFDLLGLNDDLLLDVLQHVTCVCDKKSLRLTCKRLFSLANLTIHHIVINEAVHKELYGPQRRRALCLRIAERFPAITTAVVDHLPSRGLLPRLIRQLPALTDLEGGDKVVTPAAAAALAACPGLRSLTLVIHPRTLPHLPALPLLDHLNLFLTFKPLHPPRDITPLTRFPALTSLSLHHLPDPHPDPAFLLPLAALPNLSALHFCAHSPPSPPSPGFILTHLTALVSLSVPASGTHTLSSIPALPALRELSLCGPPSPADVDTWAALRPHLPALRTLSCFFAMVAPPVTVRAPLLAHLHVHELPQPTSLPLDVATALCNMLPLPALHTLHLRTSPLAPDQTCSVLQLLAKHIPHLQDLNMDAAFCPPAVDALKQLTSLQHLTLHAWLPVAHEAALMGSLQGLHVHLPRMQSFDVRFY